MSKLDHCTLVLTGKLSARHQRFIDHIQFQILAMKRLDFQNKVINDEL